MPRYFVKLAYDGTDFHGWQYQPNSISVQEIIEISISKYLKNKIQVVGCGRTDAGVHAKEYYLHFDFDGSLDHHFIFRLNHILPNSISFEKIIPVAPEAHARYSAYSRSYQYHIHLTKSAFGHKFSFFERSFDQINEELLYESAALIAKYNSFFPFCKSNSDVNNYDCMNLTAEWSIDHSLNKMAFKIQANRFLRGMVRLIVGMSLNVAKGKLSLNDVKSGLDNQTRLPLDWSVPAQGLFLDHIRYPFFD